jgi:hypothetical protein
MKANELRIGNLVLNDNCVCAIQNIYGYGYTYCTLKTKQGNEINAQYELINPIPITEEWLVKLGFENWGEDKLFQNEYEKYIRFVLHNVIDGTSNFEVHYITSNYGSKEYKEFVISFDEDERVPHNVELKHIHQLQNLYFVLTGNELTI